MKGDLLTSTMFTRRSNALTRIGSGDQPKKCSSGFESMALNEGSYSPPTLYIFLIYRRTHDITSIILVSLRVTLSYAVSMHLHAINGPQFNL